MKITKTRQSKAGYSRFLTQNINLITVIPHQLTDARLINL